MVVILRGIFNYYEKNVIEKNIIKPKKKGVRKIRVKVCFDCKVYCPIIVNLYKAIDVLKRFEKAHLGHRTQVVNLSELEKHSSTDTVYTGVSELDVKESE